MRRAAVLIVGWLSFVPGTNGDDVGPAFYLEQVKPVLTERCSHCHGALKQEANLRLDAISAIKQGGDSGPAIVAGNSGESHLLERVTADAGSRMPPEGAPLSSDEIAVLRTWIDGGADAPNEPLPADPREHWAFQPPKRPVLDSRDGPSESNPIDSLLLAKQHDRDLTPLPEEDRSLLLRRIYLDLLGLPPTAAQLTAFTADDSPVAYEKVVDQLLASPHYGERWGRHWMDIWRYADAFGLDGEVRSSQPHMWRFRDWIIESLNADKGYDRMIQEMLAADELTPTDSKTLAASGFLGRHWYRFNRNVWLDSVVDSTCRGILGLTMNCARCHDHKYDPITHEDYFHFRAFFEPHQVRTERIPGTPDVKDDGTPRVYDAELETPTYLLIRGDEQHPDTSKSFAAAPPKSLPGAVQIEPVQLPLEAYYPAMRAFEQAEILAADKSKLSRAEKEFRLAAKTLARAEERLAGLAVTGKVTSPSKLASALASAITDNFAKPRPDFWESVTGQWDYADGRLMQQQLHAPQCRFEAVEDHPQNFRALVRLQIEEGGTRSVGIAFDQDSRGYVGVFLCPRDGKVQLYYNLDGQDVYPNAAIRSLPLENNREYELDVAVTNRQVRVSVDGSHLFTHELEIERREGRFALTTFEAAATFSLVSITPLSVDGESSGNQPREADLKHSVERAGLAAAVALSAKVQAESELASIQLRIDAEKTKFRLADEAAATSLAERARAAELRALVATADARVAVANQRIAVAKEGATAADQSSQDALAAAVKELEEAEKQLQDAKQLASQPGGDYSALGPIYPKTSTGRRLALARWITDRNNPLTARVAVNHIWARHFGEPLVGSMFDFGLRTPKPLHADLLDYLAVEFMESGWSMKKLHRLMVTSATYRRACCPPSDAASLKIDPDNHYWWRMHTRRLEGEIVRDCMLHMAGKLDPTLGGRELPVAAAATGNRRTIYYRYAREPIDKAPVMMVFDAPNVEECYRRQETIVPQHALMLMNSGMSLTAAREIAAAVQLQMPRERRRDPIAFIKAAFQCVLGRWPTDDELAACQASLERFSKLPAVGDRAQQTADERARQAILHVLLNHNDFITIR